MNLVPDPAQVFELSAQVHETQRYRGARKWPSFPIYFPLFFFIVLETMGAALQVQYEAGFLAGVCSSHIHDRRKGQHLRKESMREE